LLHYCCEEQCKQFSVWNENDTWNKNVRYLPVSMLSLITTQFLVSIHPFFFIYVPYETSILQALYPFCRHPTWTSMGLKFLVFFAIGMHPPSQRFVRLRNTCMTICLHELLEFFQLGVPRVSSTWSSRITGGIRCRRRRRRRGAEW
jgi:hypothetical protein